MISPLITNLIQNGSEPNGRIPIETILIGNNIADDVHSLISPLNLGDNPIVVCDTATNYVLGEKIAEILGVQKIVLADRVKAHEKRVSEIREKSSGATALIAVGSGTINDLCKYSSYLDGIPYIIFGTALSMNGYASANATIETADGYKKSFPAHLPKAIFFDTKILANAPRRLTASGFADTICRSTVQADWLLSHKLFGTDYNPKPFDWLIENEEKLINNSHKLNKGDEYSSQILADSLILSGLGMYVCGGSYPASQGEHLIAHTMDMLHGHTMRPSFHGEQIAVTTLTMAKLQEFMLSTKPVIRTKQINEKGVLEFFGRDLGEHCLNELEKKYITPEKAHKINEIIDNNWQNIRAEISAKMLPYEKLKRALELAQAPVNPEEIGWNRDQYRSAVKHAFLIRDRFTFLDLAYYSENLENFLETI